LNKSTLADLKKTVLVSTDTSSSTVSQDSQTKLEIHELYRIFSKLKANYWII